MADETSPPPIGWAILELMGHRKLAGLITEQEVAGKGFIRIDVFSGEAEDASATQLYSPAAVYCITPTTEDLARRLGAELEPAPVSRWELPTSVESTGEPF